MAREVAEEEKLQRSLGWRAFVGLCVMLVMWNGIEWYCMSLYADPIVNELGVTRTAFMLCLSIMAGLSALINLTVFGAMEQRFGVRRLVLAGGALNTLSLLVFGLAQSLPMLYLASFIYGFGTSVSGYGMAAAAINHWFKRRRGTMVGIANTMGSLAGIIFSPIIAALIGLVGWRVSFLTCFVLSLACLVAFFFLYKGNPDDLGVAPLYSQACEADASAEADDDAEGTAIQAGASGLQEGASFAESMRTGRFWVMCLAFFVIGAASYGIMGTLPLLSIDFGYPDLQGVVTSVALVASAVTLVILGGVCDRFGSKWGLTICCAMAAVSALLLRMESLPAIGIMVAAACSGIAYNSTISPLSVAVREAFGEADYSKKVGFCGGCAIVGVSAGPTIASLFFDLTGSYRPILLAFAVLGVASVFAFHYVMRPAKGC